MIDCLLIGHNQIDMTQYEKILRQMGTDSGFYRDLNLSFIWYNNKPYSASDIFNLFYCYGDSAREENRPVSMGETFSNAIAYLGTYIHGRGFTFDYVNSFRDDKEKLKAILKENHVLTVAVITTLYVSMLPIIEIVNFVREHNPAAKIIVGGPFIFYQFKTLNPSSIKHLFEKEIGADIYVNSSQGEATLVKILHALKNKLSWHDINNIYYKTDGRYISTPLLSENNILSDNPVQWDLFAHRIGRVVNIRTSISCPFSCFFCGYPEYAGKFQSITAGEIIHQLKQLHKIESVDRVIFIDDTFNVPRQRYKQLLPLMVKNKFRFKWISNFRAQYVDTEMVRLMKDSGCEVVFLGLESGSDKILENMNKMSSVGKYLDGIARLKEQGILTMGSFILGFPGETQKTVRQTIEFIKKSGIDFFRVHLWYCQPITPIWRQRNKFKLKGDAFDWEHETMDCRTASHMIYDIFSTIDEPVWVPQYDFEFNSIWNLLERGMTLEEVKKFLGAFQQGVKQKIMNPNKKDVTTDVIRQISETAAPCSLLPDNGDKQPKTVIANDLENTIRFNF